jgi:hypothetical protein
MSGFFVILNEVKNLNYNADVSPDLVGINMTKIFYTHPVIQSLFTFKLPFLAKHMYIWFTS